MIPTEPIRDAMRRVRTLTVLRRIAKPLCVIYGVLTIPTSLIVFLDVKDVTTLFLPGTAPAWVVWRAIYFFIQSVAIVALANVTWRVERDDFYVRNVAPFLESPNAVFTRVSGMFRVVLIVLAIGYVLQFIDESAQRATIFAPLQLTFWLVALVMLIVGLFPIPFPAREIQGRKTIRGAFLRAAVYVPPNVILDQRYGPRARLALADAIKAEYSARTSYVGGLSIFLSDPEVGDGRPFVINTSAVGDPTLLDPRSQLRDLTIATLEIVHKTFGYEGRVAVGFLDLPKVNEKNVSCRGTIYREGARVFMEPDADLAPDDQLI